MRLKGMATACVMAALVIAPAERAAADGSALVGGILGAIIGGAIVNEANKGRVQRRTTSTRSSVSSAQRQANRDVQVALNYFGFPVGSADGVLGRNSRSSIASYQAMLGYPATGQLTQYEQSFLVGSHQRAIAGGALTAQQVAGNPMGVRGLLVAYRDEAMGNAPAQAGLAQAAVALPPAVQTQVDAADAAVLATPGALPTFLGGDVAQASLASHCNKVSLLTNSNGGFVTAATMTDATFALNEQFCLARTYAISQGEDMAAQVQGFTPAQIAQQCEGFGPAMQDQVAALSLKPRDEVLQGVSGFVLTTGMAPAQLVGTAKICLSVGYRTDNMPVALASALLLTALGDKVYAELVGHHLAQGFGTSQRADLALAWYEMGLDALSGGAAAVFVPGQADRTDLIRKAAFTLGGRAEPDAPAALPTFALAPAPGAETAVAVAEPVVEPMAEPVPEVAVAVVAAPEAGAQAGGSVANAVGFVARLPMLLMGN